MTTPSTDISWHIVCNVQGKKVVVPCGDATQRVKVPLLLFSSCRHRHRHHHHHLRNRVPSDASHFRTSLSLPFLHSPVSVARIGCDCKLGSGCSSRVQNSRRSDQRSRRPPLGRTRSADPRCTTGRRRRCVGHLLFSCVFCVTCVSKASCALKIKPSCISIFLCSVGRDIATPFR